MALLPFYGPILKPLMPPSLIFRPRRRHFSGLNLLPKLRCRLQSLSLECGVVCSFSDISVTSGMYMCGGGGTDCGLKKKSLPF